MFTCGRNVHPFDSECLCTVNGVQCVDKVCLAVKVVSGSTNTTQKMHVRTVGSPVNDSRSLSPYMSRKDRNCR